MLGKAPPLEIEHDTRAIYYPRVFLTSDIRLFVEAYPCDPPPPAENSLSMKMCDAGGEKTKMSDDECIS